MMLSPAPEAPVVVAYRLCLRVDAATAVQAQINAGERYELWLTVAVWGVDLNGTFRGCGSTKYFALAALRMG